MLGKNTRVECYIDRNSALYRQEFSAQPQPIVLNGTFNTAHFVTTANSKL